MVVQIPAGFQKASHSNFSDVLDAKKKSLLEFAIRSRTFFVFICTLVSRAINLFEYLFVVRANQCSPCLFYTETQFAQKIDSFS